MSYTIQFSNTSLTPITIPDSTVDTTTSLKLIGRNTSNYGQANAENLLHLLENFSKVTQPANSITGQLWYDTGTSTLRIYNGSTYVPVNGFYRQSGFSNRPTGTYGEIWVDTDTSQLYVWGTDGTWWNVGLNNNNQLGKNGSYATTLLDTVSSSHDCVITYVNDKVITITTKDSFTPNPVINGFTKLSPGVNISKATFITGSESYIPRVSGYSEAALSLKLTSATDPVSADNFLRNDTAGTISGFLKINSNAGIWIGADSQTVLLERVVNTAVLSNRTSGSNIGLSVLKGSVLNQILTVDGNNLRVGINTTTPTVELDVVGSAKISSNLNVLGISTFTGNVNVIGNITSNLTLSSGLKVTSGISTFTNSVVVLDNVSVAGITTMTGKVIVGSEVYGSSIEPANSGISDLGSSSKSFRNVYASNTFSIGMMVPYAGSSPPTGWLLCDGSAYSSVTYASLYAILSPTYGSNLPNLTLTAAGPHTVYFIIKY
jgi:hypothetical protein